MQIEVFSDVVCPWCYIGKRRLDAVLAEPGNEDLRVTWRPYQLYPQLPPGGVPRESFMRARFGDGAEPDDIYRRVMEEAREAGLALDFRAIAIAPNTLDAHRLLSWAEFSGRQHDLAEALFRAYFQQGRDVGDADVLAATAGEVGLDGAAAAQMLAGQDEMDKVRQELSLADAVGVTGVPFFVLSGRFAIPGAQAVDTLRQLIARARTRLAETTG